MLLNTDSSEAWVSSDGLFVGDHFPVIGVISADKVPPNRSKRLAVRLPATIKAGDKGARKRLTASLEKALKGNLSGWSVSQITDWTVKEAIRIQASRNTKNNPDGWSPVSRLLHIRLRIIGALFKRMVDKAGLGACYHLYTDLKRDMRRIVLNDDEKDWLGQNGIPEGLPD